MTDSELEAIRERAKLPKLGDSISLWGSEAHADRVRLLMEVDRLRAEAESLKWKPTKWWRAVTPDEELWCESSREKEVRERARPGDKIQRLWETLPNTEWRDED